MRAKGRHGREMEERFCFLAASDQMASQIYQHGLRVGSTVQYALGKPSHGVYLFRHVDVGLKSNTSVLSLTKVVIFKVCWMFPVSYTVIVERHLLMEWQDVVNIVMFWGFRFFMERWKKSLQAWTGTKRKIPLWALTATCVKMQCPIETLFTSKFWAPLWVDLISE